MSELERSLINIRDSLTGDRAYIDRLRHEASFAQALLDNKPELKEKWQSLLDEAIANAEKELSVRPVDPKAVVERFEQTLAPIGEEAKKYTIYCVGHAHIDMNWMWAWQETVAVTNDTFSTVDKLMDEFPDFHFSQSQASTYIAVKEYLPELYERLKQRVAEGRWEITASTWVEGGRNCAAGETMCRHLLYTKRFISEEFGLPVDAVKVDWEPDLFGHAHTVPGILSRAGVKLMYFCRGGKGPKLFWFQAPDGSRVLAFDDSELWYNGHMDIHDRTPLGGPVGGHINSALMRYERETGLKDYLFVYGVGDHGGGPTRRDLMAAAEINSWPIFPNIKLSTVDEYLSVIEPQLPDDLPVINDELNFVFPGCYTSQSNIKRANRFSENRCVEAEIAAIIGWKIAGMEYPTDDIFTSWRHTMFNQFHDILPGSGVHATYEYAQGLFQEVLARTGMVKTRALRKMASKICTAITSEPTGGEAPGSKVGVGIGGGAGNESSAGRVSTLSAGAVSSEPFVLFNPTPWSRTDLGIVKIWDKEMPGDRVQISTPDGQKFAGQVIERGGYWGHNFTTVVFPVEELPPLGYRTYEVSRVYSPVPSKSGIATAGNNVIENEFIRVEVDQRAGAISSLIDKRTGYDLVPEGKRLGFLQWLLEAPHGMTAWEIGQIIKQIDLLDGATLDMPHRGPYLGTIRARHKLHDSEFTIQISLKAGVPRVDFKLDINWLERGHPGYGVPMLKAVFPVSVKADKATFEIPFGSIRRPTNGQEVPSLRWADLTGERTDGNGKAGITLLNDYKYGHNAGESELKLTLLRSSYDPDPLPELGSHTIHFAVVPHAGDLQVSDFVRLGREFSHEIEVVGTDAHEGDLPPEAALVSVDTPNVILSGMKKAEDDDSIILRFYETDGKSTTAQVTISDLIVPGDSKAVEVDLLERPIDANSASMRSGVLKFSIPAYGITSVKIG